MITLTNIKKIYNSDGVLTPALNGVNLTVNAGEYIAVKGSSGSGKSTLLHILGAMDTVTEGCYQYDNIDVTKLNKSQLQDFRKKHISFVFQNYALMKYYTVYENVEIPLLALGIKKSLRKQMIEEHLEKLGIKDLAKKLPIHISGGQKQRCAIARALVAQNDILLADEPTGALDNGTTEELLDIFDSIKSKDRIFILATHDETVAQRADRIIMIEDGVIK